jgi:CubicO group peptidase (beta-lactamase class C family)
VSRAVVLAAAFLLVGCGGTHTDRAPAPEPKLRLDVARRAGLDPARLERADDRFASTPGLLSVLVMRHGSVVFERYYQGATAAQVHDVFSITKSVVSALVGIELARGELDGLDQRLVDFFPDRLEHGADPRIRSITLRDLLTMTAGYRATTVAPGDDVIRRLLNRPLATEPGTAFWYDDGSAHLLSAILERASGMSTEELARRTLFEPLGIHPGRWLTDHRGTTLGSTGLLLHSRDLLALGELYLEQGRRNGRQIVPTAWVRDSTRVQARVPGGYAHGYLWWVNTGPHGGFLAQGYAGQALAVDPRLDLVVAVSGSGGFDHVDVVRQVLRAVVR